MVFFTFIRIPNFFKLLLAGLSLAFYSVIIFGVVGRKGEFGTPKAFFAVSTNISYLFFFNLPFAQSESFGYEVWTSSGSRNLSHFAFLAAVLLYFLILGKS